MNTYFTPRAHSLKLAILLALGLFSPVHAEYHSDGVGLLEAQVVANEIIVKLRQPKPSGAVDSQEALAAQAAQRAEILEQIAALQAELGAKRNRKFSSIGAELWELPATISGADAIQQLQHSYPNIEEAPFEYVEPNYKLFTQALPNDRDLGNQWGMNNTGQSGGKADADIDAAEAWDRIGTTGNDIVVAVIDTGIDYQHEDLKDALWVNAKEVAGNKVDDDQNGYVDDVNGYDFANKDGDPMDDNHHGTHCAGIIAAKGNNKKGVAGVYWKAKIMALKFLDAEGGGDVADAVTAIEYARQMGAKISSNSWGCTSCNSQALAEAIKAAGDSGHLFIAAAGNHAGDNDQGPKNYPSSYDLENIIAVAATDRNDQLASFSGYGKTSVDLAAPGVDIYSTTPGDSTTTTGQYAAYSGTSMATPYVAGVAALLWSQSPTLGWTEVKKRLLLSVDKLDSLADKMVAGGRLNAYSALILDVPKEGDKVPPVAKFDLTQEGLKLTVDSTPSSDKDGQIVNRTWIISSPASGADFAPMPSGGESGVDAFITVKTVFDLPGPGTYTIKLIVTDNDKLSGENEWTVTIPGLPELGNGVGTDPNGDPVATTATFAAGVALDGIAYEKKIEVNLTNPVDVMGQIKVEPGHVGEVADLVVFAEFPMENQTLWFMLNTAGIPLLWDQKPATLAAFRRKVRLTDSYPVPMYKGEFLAAGVLHIYFGYRLQNGTLIKNGEFMDVTIKQ